MTSADKKEIRDGLQQLKYGYLSEITERTKKIREGGFSYSYVQKVLIEDGPRDNPDIWLIALEVLKERREQKARIERQMRLALNEVKALAV